MEVEKIIEIAKEMGYNLEIEQIEIEMKEYGEDALYWAIEPIISSWKAERAFPTENQPGPEFGITGWIGKIPVWAPRSPLEEFLWPNIGGPDDF